MASDQKADTFETPPYDEIPAITRSHVAFLESTNDEEAWLSAGMKSVIIQTVGRKSGKAHKVVLPYWADAGGHRILAASYAGGPVNPAWYHNLADRQANPTIWVKERSFEGHLRADLLVDEDYRRVWDGLTSDRPWYLDYLAKTKRASIPLIRLIDPEA
jgi:deazaflavin-dependent oxidoreductase (nitroreductase family)